jgi:hypothetical protein
VNISTIWKDSNSKLISQLGGVTYQK